MPQAGVEMKPTGARVNNVGESQVKGQRLCGEVGEEGGWKW